MGGVSSRFTGSTLRFSLFVGEVSFTAVAAANGSDNVGKLSSRAAGAAGRSWEEVDGFRQDKIYHVSVNSTFDRDADP